MSPASGDIVVVGVSGTSRDTLEALEATNAVERRWTILGFVDDDPRVHGAQVLGYPVLGPTSLLQEGLARAAVAIGVANDRNLLVRREIRSRLGLSPDRCPTLTHPAAVVSPRAVVGAGTIFLSGVFCSNGVSVGEHVVVLQNSVIGHDCRIDADVSISANVSIAGSVQVGEGSYLGIGSSILPGRRLGKGVIVGIGAVVLRDVPDGVVVAGNPARVLGPTRREAT